MTLEDLLSKVPWAHCSAVTMEPWPVAYQDIDHLSRGILDRAWGQKNPTVLLAFGLPEEHWLRAKTHPIDGWNKLTICSFLAPDLHIALHAVEATLNSQPTNMRCHNEECVGPIMDADWELLHAEGRVLARCRLCGNVGETK